MPALASETIRGDIAPGQSCGPFPGRVEVLGSVLEGAELSAGGDITIRGSVNRARVSSSGGGVYVDHGVVGPDAVITALGDVKTPFVREASVDCMGSVHVRDMIYLSTVRARGAVAMRDGGGIVEASSIEAGVEIVVKSAGNQRADAEERETELAIENIRQKELFEITMVYEQRLSQKTVRVGELQRVIDVIRILGDRLTALSDEKRLELALKVKEFNELKVQIEEIENERRKVMAERAEENNLQRAIIATSYVYPGVEVRIDNARVRIGKLYRNVILYKSGIVIIGDLDAFMKRKRLMVGS